NFLRFSLVTLAQTANNPTNSIVKCASRIEKNCYIAGPI
ncbi:MAG: hypothetical protein ACJA2O_004168, partial [Candidatus Azotimanducaceae bacterium]